MLMKESLTKAEVQVLFLYSPGALQLARQKVLLRQIVVTKTSFILHESSTQRELQCCVGLIINVN